MALPEQDDRITPVEELFTYHIFGVPDQVRQYEEDASSYELAIGGLVGQELHLSLEDLRAGFPQVSGVMILQCMTDVHWGRLRFTGARLLDVLERAALAAMPTRLPCRRRRASTRICASTRYGNGQIASCWPTP